MLQSGCRRAAARLEHVESRSGDLSRPQGSRQIVQIDNGASSDVDEISVPFHLLKLRSAKHLDGSRRVRGGDDDEIALSQQIRQTLAGPQGFDSRRRFGSPGSTATMRIPKARPRRATSSPMLPKPTTPSVASLRRRWARSMALTSPGPWVKETRAFSPPLGAHWPRRLLKNVAMQIAGETEDVTEDVIGDDVGEEAAHVRQHAGMRDQFGKKIMLQTGRRRLHPA